MPYKSSSRCSICLRIKAEPKLKKRIWDSKKFNPHDKGAETLTDIQRHYNFSYRSLESHCTKHQYLDPERMADKELERIAKRSENKAIIKERRDLVEAETVWDEVIVAAREGIKNGEIKLNANHLLKAAKDKTDYNLKKTGQKMQMMEMIAHFASGEYIGSTQYDGRAMEGETATAYNAAEITAGGALEGAFGPDTIYNGDAGDATPPRASEVLEGDDF